ncbi:MAG: hypothetical protein K8T25_23720 [Planctomycetia bacterium]|nr:hypothetical protein [Planctomycetia bacterium]
MSPTLSAEFEVVREPSQEVGTSLAVSRIPNAWLAESAAAPDHANLKDSVLSVIAADLAQAAQRATLQPRDVDSWVQLELDLWKAMTATVEKWRRRAPSPGAFAQRSDAARTTGQSRIVGPVRFQLRHR